MAAGWGLERAIRAQMTERGSSEPRQREENRSFTAWTQIAGESVNCAPAVRGLGQKQ